MNWIDIILSVVLCISVIFGFVDGPICQILRICSLFLSFCVALFYHAVISNIFYNVFSVSLHNVLSYFILFGLAALITTIISDFPKNMVDNLKMGGWYNVLCAVLGFVKGTILCGAIIFGILNLCSMPACEMVCTSKIATVMGNGMQNVAAITSNNFFDPLKKNRGSDNAKMAKGTEF